MLVRIAIARYILDGTETDVSQAVGSLCAHLQSRLVPQARQSADDFRFQCCYVEGVSRMLAEHKKSLRAIFDVYADLPNLKPPKEKLMTFQDWQLLLRHLNFFDAAFEQREGTLAFVFSRLRCIDEESKRGENRLKHLAFEDFLEALVRCSTMKTLPTRTELMLAGASDAGTFLIGLRTNPSAYNSFVEERERSWDDPLRQPIERCVEGILALIIRTIERSIGMDAGDFRLSKSEILRFHKQGGAINMGRAATPIGGKALNLAGGNGGGAAPGGMGGLAALASGGRRESSSNNQPPAGGGGGGSGANFLAPSMGMRAAKWGSKARAANAAKQPPSADTAEGGAAQSALGAFTRRPVVQPQGVKGMLAALSSSSAATEE